MDGSTLQTLDTKKRSAERYERGRSPHPGIVIIEPKLDGKTRLPLPGHRYRLRIDAAFGVHALDWAGAIPDEYGRSAKKREAYAQLAYDTMRLRMGLHRGQALIPGQIFLAEAIADYVKSKHRKAGNTQDNVRRNLARFEAWAKENRIAYVEDLTQLTLSKYRTHLDHAPSQTSEGKCKASTLNQYLKDVRAFLYALVKGGTTLNIARDKIKDALERFEVPKGEDFDARALTVPEIRTLLEAALKLDAEPLRARSVQMAPWIVVGILAGMRRSEQRSLLVSDVKLGVLIDEETRYLIELRESKSGETKTGERRIEIEGYSELLRELLARMCEGREPSDALFPIGAKGLGYAWTRLRKLGCPADASIKTLRSTCATFQDSLAIGVSSRAARLGHSIRVAERYYFDRGTPIKRKRTATLEEAMACADLIRTVIERYEWRPMRKDGGDK
jgi:site-specific recombinase XerD